MSWHVPLLAQTLTSSMMNVPRNRKTEKQDQSLLRVADQRLHPSWIRWWSRGTAPYCHSTAGAAGDGGTGGCLVRGLGRSCWDVPKKTKTGSKLENCTAPKVLSKFEFWMINMFFQKMHRFSGNSETWKFLRGVTGVIWISIPLKWVFTQSVP